MAFQQLVRYWGLQYWVKRKNWKRSQKAGRCYFNIFRNGNGLGCDYVILNKFDGSKVSINMSIPLILDAAKEIKLRKPARTGKKRYKWKKQIIVDEHGKVLWRKKDARETKRRMEEQSKQNIRPSE